MCTSFVKKTDDNCYIAMNFDNNGMKYRINTTKKDWLIVYVEMGKMKYPSFGIHKSGIFFNNLLVNACEKGKYRRGKGVVHSTKFLTEIIDNKICVDTLKQYLENIEIVNVPNFSTHNMICDIQSNVWIIEPGRGNIYSSLKSNEFQVMTNFSLVDATKNKETNYCKRFNNVNKLLSELVNMNVQKAFEILRVAKQSEGEWITEISMVFDKTNETVYYCENQNFENIKEFVFQ